MATITTTVQPATVSPLKRLIRVHPLVAYFVLAFACMWIPVLPLTLSRNAGIGLLPYDLPDVLMYVLLALTTFSGPTLAAIIVIGVTEGRQSVKQFLKRFIQWRVGLAWYLVALFIMLLIWLLGYTAVVGLPLLFGAVSHWSLLLTAFLPFVGFGILIPGIDEEPGWRGFALPRLQQRYGPFWASVILGTLHGLWHIPAVFTMLFGPLPFADLLPFILVQHARNLPVHLGIQPCTGQYSDRGADARRLQRGRPLAHHPAEGHTPVAAGNRLGRLYRRASMAECHRFRPGRTRPDRDYPRPAWIPGGAERATDRTIAPRSGASHSGLR